MFDDALPPDIVAFLRGDRTLNCEFADCEIGRFAFHLLDGVPQIELLLSTQGDDWIDDDPHSGIGHYVVDALDLLASCDDYDPEVFSFTCRNSNCTAHSIATTNRSLFTRI